MLLCGLDGSGKTTLIKHYSSALEEFAKEYPAPKPEEQKQQAAGAKKEEAKPWANSEFFCTTPYINIEKIYLPDTLMPCVVYDLSGQVSTKRNT